MGGKEDGVGEGDEVERGGGERMEGWKVGPWNGREGAGREGCIYFLRGRIKRGN